MVFISYYLLENGVQPTIILVLHKAELLIEVKFCTKESLKKTQTPNAGLLFNFCSLIPAFG